MPDLGVGSGDKDLVSEVLPEASGGTTVRDRKLGAMGPWPDPEGLFLGSYVLM